MLCWLFNSLRYGIEIYISRTPQVNYVCPFVKGITAYYCLFTLLSGGTLNSCVFVFMIVLKREKTSTFTALLKKQNVIKLMLHDQYKLHFTSSPHIKPPLFIRTYFRCTEIVI